MSVTGEPAALERRALAELARHWRRIAPSFGLPRSAPPPAFVLVPGGGGDLYTEDEGDHRAIHVGPGFVRQITGKNGANRDAAEWKASYECCRVFQHFTHDQAYSPRNYGDGQAIHFANLQQRELRGKARPGAARAYARKHFAYWGTPPQQVPSLQADANPGDPVAPPPPAVQQAGATPAAAKLDPRATKMSSAALERVLANGNADPGIRASASQVLSRRRGKPARRGGRPHRPRPRGRR